MACLNPWCVLKYRVNEDRNQEESIVLNGGVQRPQHRLNMVSVPHNSAQIATAPAVTESILQQVRTLNASAYILRFDRNEVSFRPGQHLRLGVPGHHQSREYSIYSGLSDPFLEVLIREVKRGTVSRELRACRPGDTLRAQGPLGVFRLDGSPEAQTEHLFIATGTGIAPFHSMIRSIPALNYTLLHGIRSAQDSFEMQDYDPSRIITCSRRDPACDFKGRVTDYIQRYPVDPRTRVYLCGNCDMIYEAHAILTSQGIPALSIRTEVYF